MKKVALLLLTAALLGCSGSPTPASNSPAATRDRAPELTDETVQTPYLNASPEEFAELIGRPNTVLLDVRTPGETRNGVIEGARELDFRSPNFEAALEEFPRDKTYLVYCASGGRSSQTCAQMAEMGFQKVYNLAGGYSAWIEE